MPQSQDPTKQPTDDGIVVDGTICDAILQRHWLQFRIGAMIHVVEPHRYGVMPDGHHALWAWNLVTGGSETSAQVGWAHYRLDEMRDVQMLAETFEGPRPGYRRAKTAMRAIHSQL